MKKIDNYLNQLYLEEELQLLDEALFNVVKKFTSDKIKLLVGTLKRGDLKKVKKIGDSFGITRIKPAKLNSFAKSKIPSYKDSKNISERVLKNSIPGLSKNMLNHASSLIAIASVIPKKKGVAPKSPKVRTKELLKDVVMRSRKWQDDYMDKGAEGGDKIPPESVPDYAVGITLVFIMTSLAGASMWFIITALPGVIFMIQLTLVIVAALSIAGGVIYGVVKAAAAAAGRK